ncbi:MAG: hypothetical protein M3362_00360 [Acidobacteriota bacterium]|nr:hypothetical protein [Acidobacteriota bacterium]
MEDIKRLEQQLAERKKQVLDDLIKQRDELDRQIAELQGERPRRGRKPGSKKGSKKSSK